MAIFYDRFMELCKLRNEKPTPLLNKLKSSSTNMKRWKNGSSVNFDTVKKLAEYFDVPIDYFFSDNAECRQIRAKFQMKSVILDEIAAVQTLMARCEETLNRLETIYKNLGEGESR